MVNKWVSCFLPEEPIRAQEKSPKSLGRFSFRFISWLHFISCHANLPYYVSSPFGYPLPVFWRPVFCARSVEISPRTLIACWAPHDRCATQLGMGRWFIPKPKQRVTKFQLITCTLTKTSMDTRYPVIVEAGFLFVFKTIIFRVEILLFGSVILCRSISSGGIDQGLFVSLKNVYIQTIPWMPGCLGC